MPDGRLQFSLGPQGRPEDEVTGRGCPSVGEGILQLAAEALEAFTLVLRDHHGEDIEQPGVFGSFDEDGIQQLQNERPVGLGLLHFGSCPGEADLQPGVDESWVGFTFFPLGQIRQRFFNDAGRFGHFTQAHHGARQP